MVMNYLLLDESSGMVTNTGDGNQLLDYTTLLLKLDEQFGGANGRENHIQAFLQNPSVYPNWNSPDDQRWTDDTAVFPTPVQWQAPVTTDNVDDRLTSANFDVDRPSEIAIHVFYDQAGANKKFFDDFGFKLDGFQGPGSDVDQIQY
jgi:hypothetical protein